MCLFLLLCGILTLGNLVFNRNYFSVYAYIFDEGPSSRELTLKVFWSFWLMLNSLLPLEIECAI